MKTSRPSEPRSTVAMTSTTAAPSARPSARHGPATHPSTRSSESTSSIHALCILSGRPSVVMINHTLSTARRWRPWASQSLRFPSASHVITSNHVVFQPMHPARGSTRSVHKVLSATAKHHIASSISTTSSMREGTCRVTAVYRRLPMICMLRLMRAHPLVSTQDVPVSRSQADVPVSRSQKLRCQHPRQNRSTKLKQGRP